jgi:hypothetical protein
MTYEEFLTEQRQPAFSRPLAPGEPVNPGDARLAESERRLAESRAQYEQTQREYAQALQPLADTRQQIAQHLAAIDFQQRATYLPTPGPTTALDIVLGEIAPQCHEGALRGFRDAIAHRVSGLDYHSTRAFVHNTLSEPALAQIMFKPPQQTGPPPGSVEYFAADPAVAGRTQSFGLKALQPGQQASVPSLAGWSSQAANQHGENMPFRPQEQHTLPPIQQAFQNQQNVQQGVGPEAWSQGMGLSPLDQVFNRRPR